MAACPKAKSGTAWSGAGKNERKIGRKTGDEKKSTILPAIFLFFALTAGGILLVETGDKRLFSATTFVVL